MRRRVSWRSSVGAQFWDRRRRFRGDRRGHALSVRATELAVNRSELALLKLADRDAAPAIRGANDGRVHQLEHGPLTERVRDDLGAPALLEEEPLEEIRRPDHLAVAERKAKIAMQASKSARKHVTSAGSSRSYAWTKSSRSSVASGAEAAS